MPLFSFIPGFITSHGIDPSFNSRQRKAVILINIFWVTSVIGFLLFFLFLLLCASSNVTALTIGYITLTIGFIITGLLVKYKRRHYAKILLLVIAYSSIFFYDNYTGADMGISSYYIVYLFITLNLFSYRSKGGLLFFFSLLPVIMFIGTAFLQENIVLNSIKESMIIPFRTFNYFLSFLLVSCFGIYIVRYNSKNEDFLEQSNINLQTLIDNTEGSIWSITVDYRIIVANQVYKKDMKKIFDITVHPGYDMTPIVQGPTYPDQWRTQYGRVFGGETFNEEYLFEKNTFELLATPIYSVAGSVIGAAFYARDITYRKMAEQELVSAKMKAEEASKAKAIFLSNMSHELRTPLNGIIGTTHILQEEEHLPAQTHSLNILTNLSEHMLGLVNDILDYNKIESGMLDLNPHIFSIKKFIKGLHNTFLPLFEDKRLEFKLDIDPQLEGVEVLADDLRLLQVLNNLVFNALKFTHQGAVTVSCSMISSTDSHVKILFSVEDTGIGIDPKVFETIFESFSQGDTATTRKYGGTGLGLSISSNLVKLMNSKLYVNSKKGSGSNFYFQLEAPLYKKEQEGKMADTKLQEDYLSNLRVLVAEDNQINMMVARKILEKKGVIVTEAVNGKIAVEKIMEMDFDVALLDLEMPIMDGKTALQEIKKINKHMPVIAFTAAVYENMKQELMDYGFADCIYKPFKSEDLYQKIIEVVQKKEL
jgi:signal transduction histidine kinase/CheY-like chemotaxis protein